MVNLWLLEICCHGPTDPLLVLLHLFVSLSSKIHAFGNEKTMKKCLIDSVLFGSVAPPPKAKDSRRQNGGIKEDLFGSVPFNPPTPGSETTTSGTSSPPSNAITKITNNHFNDPFEMGEFGVNTPQLSSPSQQDLENAIGLLDKRLLEMKVRV